MIKSEFEDSFQQLMKARKAITDKEQGKRGVAGKIICPVCGTGELRYSIAKCNGHIHAACTTEDCVRWME